jgi:hypothetical protein
MTVSKLSARGDRALKGAQHNRARAHKHSRKAIPAPILGERIEGDCATCDHEFDATFRRDRYGISGWAIGSHSDRCPRGADCLAAIAEQFGCPSAAELKFDPRPWLAGQSTTARRRQGPPQAFPTSRERLRFRRAARNGDPLRYLTVERGLDRGTIARYGIGYGRVAGRAPGFVLPVYGEADPLVDDSPARLVQIMIRHWPNPWRLISGGKRRAQRLSVLRGRSAGLYPNVPHDFAILCEGGFDALIGRQHGLPTVTTTCGATLPEPLADRFVGIDVAVIYDVGANTRRTVERLRAAGAGQVSVVDLATAGLEDGEDMTDWFVSYGRTAADLRRLIRHAGRRAQ